MMSKNTLAAALASAGIAAAMLPTTASAATAPQPPSTTTGGIGTLTGVVLDVAPDPAAQLFQHALQQVTQNPYG
jgi:hypothetical protein